MDPTYISIIVGIVSSLITAAVMGAVTYGALRAWMAKRETREEQNEADIADHETRLRMIEYGPVDYVPR